MGNTVTHPIEKGTKVKYLTPKCPCVGKGYDIKIGIVTNSFEKNGNFVYNITTTNHRIPQRGVVELLG